MTLTEPGVRPEGALSAAGALVDHLQRVAGPDQFGRALALGVPAIMACERAACVAADLDRGVLRGHCLPAEFVSLDLPFDVPFDQLGSAGTAPVWRPLRSGGVAVWLWGGPGWAFGLALHRDHGTCDEDDVAVLAWLTPLLRACWDLSLWRCARDVAPPGAGSQAGVVLVSTELGPLSTDATAASLLAGTELDGQHLAGRLALRDLVADAPPDHPVTVGDVTLRVQPADDEESLAILVVAPAPAALQVGLTARQLQVLRLSAAGAAPKQVARQLGISPRTAEKHLEQAYRRLGVSTRFQAMGAL